MGVQIRSTISLPFTQGTLVLRSSDPDAFDEGQIELLRRVTEQVSLSPSCQS